MKQKRKGIRKENRKCKKKKEGEDVKKIAVQTLLFLRGEIAMIELSIRGKKMNF